MVNYYTLSEKNGDKINNAESFSFSNKKSKTKFNFLLQQSLCAFFLQRNTKWKTDYSACTGIGYSSLLLIKCET